MKKTLISLCLLGLVVFLSSCEKEGSPNALGTPDSANGEFTNKQESDVDEADHVKIGPDHIFVEVEEGIDVIDRAEFAYMGRLQNEERKSTLYTYQDRLVRISEEVPDYRQYYYPRRPLPQSKTHVSVFSSEKGIVPTKLKTIEIDGKVLDSRMVGSRLILVFRDEFYSPDVLAERLEASQNKDVNGTPCGNISRPMVEDLDLRLNRVVTLDILNPDAAPKTAAVMGGGDEIYMTSKHLYIAKNGIQWHGHGGDMDEELILSKVGFQDGEPIVLAAGGVSGRVKDQWAFKEVSQDQKDTLLVATTTGKLWGSGEERAQNHFWSVQQKGRSLEVVDGVFNYGSGEDIRAVRYVNDTAYVVTFKKTDPLFAFDIANPEHPKLLGELKVPGFSTYLHPDGNERLIGVGFDASDQGSFAYFQGIQVSLFDVRNPIEMSRLDNHVLGERGSYSDVTTDHHAFFYDPQERLLGIPIVELGDGYVFQFDREVRFSGAVLYNVGEQNLNETQRISHADMIPSHCRSKLGQGRWWSQAGRSLDINRLYKVDGNILAVSQFGLSQHLISTLPDRGNRLALPNRDCNINSGIYW